MTPPPLNVPAPQLIVNDRSLMCEIWNSARHVYDGTSDTTVEKKPTPIHQYPKTTASCTIQYNTKYFIVPYKHRFT